MRSILALMLCIGFADARVAGESAEFPLTRDGKPAAVIITASEPTATAALAARELQYHVRKITGATLPIVTDEKEVSGPRILVGRCKPLNSTRLDVDDLGEQEYAIRFLPDTLVLTGREPTEEEAVRQTPKRGAGRFGQALSFDGASRPFVVPACGFNDDVGALEAWVWMPKERQSTHGTILRLDGGSPWTYHILQRDVNSSRVSYSTFDGKQARNVSSGELEEGWHHVAGTHDAAAGKIELFVDGVSVGTSAYEKTACADAPLGIGGAITDAGAEAISNPFRGRIDEVRVSNAARNVGKDAAGPRELDRSTTCLYRFDESAGRPRNAVKGFIAVPRPSLFDDNGTLYAVYDFLERFCDVRWYAPGEIGLVCPKTPTLVVRGADVRRRPAMKHRWITPTALYMPAPPQAVPDRDLYLWKQRMRIGGQAFWVCHSFEGYYDRFLKTHPEWFARGYEGRPPQMCYTDPEFVKQVVADAREFFDGLPAKSGAAAAGDVFGLVPMDNCSWCKCPRCQKELNQVDQNNQQFNNGKAGDYVYGFVNKVAREVRKTHPDKWIGALAYSEYAYYPSKEPVEKNVIVQLCLHTRNWWCPSMEANDRKTLAEWRGRDPQRPLYVWLYYNFPACNGEWEKFHYFPGYFAHAVIPQMELYRQANVQGIFMEHSSEFNQSYLADQLEFYVTLKLADDPTLDGNRLIDEFFGRYYGAAGKPMKELYSAIESTFWDPNNYPPEIRRSPAHQHQTKHLARDVLTTKERMNKFAELMDKAKKAAATPEEKQRVAMFERGQWDYMLKGAESDGK